MYYITYSEYYPIYEPAEGGYYYSGKEVQYTEVSQTFRKARKKIKRLLKEMRDEVTWVADNKLSFGYNGKYIGDGWIYELTNKPVKEKGYEPYC